MAYTTGNLILATDYNTFRTSVNDVYADNNIGATTEASASFGYGQTPLPVVTAGQLIGRAEWNLLFKAIRDCSTHQGSTIVDLPDVTNDDKVTAIIPTLPDRIATIRTNRLTRGINTGGVTSPGSTTRTTAWDDPISHTVSATFANWNSMRYFFNAGGKINFSVGFTGTPDNQTETEWVGMAAALQTIAFGASTTESSGGVGYLAGGSGIGFYDLSTVYNTVFQWTPQGYTTEKYDIQARLNAAPGSATTIQFLVTFTTPNGGDIINIVLSSNRDVYNPSEFITVSIPTLTSTPIS
jgi:hypothetical protein